jgi:hypothetical protein
VRAGDASCPFCASALGSDLESQAVPAAKSRLSRSALIAFAASISMAACGGEVDSDKKPVTDAGGDGLVQDTGGNVAMYGAPADTGLVDDTGGGGALYGAPADTGAADTGADDDGGPIPAYGIPPSDAG